MEVVYERCAGLDVHKKGVTVCRITSAAGRGWQKETRRYGTMTAELLELADWLRAGQVQAVAMESTGVYWKPVFNILESEFEVILVNARHIKYVPGRKSDVSDAQWIGELLQHGLLKASYIPEQPQWDLRDLIRYRTALIQERVREINRVQKVLEVIYENWQGYHEKLCKCIAPLTNEQLLLQPASGMWPLGQIVQHIISVRAGWFSGTLQDDDEVMNEYMLWGQRESPARSAAELVRGLDET